jgi:hypothetical protein
MKLHVFHFQETSKTKMCGNNTCKYWYIFPLLLTPAVLGCVDHSGSQEDQSSKEMRRY